MTPVLNNNRVTTIPKSLSPTKSTRTYVKIDGRVLTAKETIRECEEAKEKKRKREAKTPGSQKKRRTLPSKEVFPTFPALIIHDHSSEEGGEYEEDDEILEEGIVTPMVGLA